MKHLRALYFGFGFLFTMDVELLQFGKKVHEASFNDPTMSFYQKGAMLTDFLQSQNVALELFFKHQHLYRVDNHSFHATHGPYILRIRFHDSKILDYDVFDNSVIRDYLAQFYDDESEYVPQRINSEFVSTEYEESSSSSKRSRAHLDNERLYMVDDPKNKRSIIRGPLLEYRKVQERLENVGAQQNTLTGEWFVSSVDPRTIERVASQIRRTIELPDSVLKGDLDAQIRPTKRRPGMEMPSINGDQKLRHYSTDHVRAMIEDKFMDPRAKWHGLVKQGWTIRWHQMDKQLGVCDFPLKILYLSPQILRSKSYAEREFIHHISHALVKSNRHSSEWKKIVHNLGLEHSH